MNKITCIVKRNSTGDCNSPVNDIIEHGVLIEYSGKEYFFKAPYKVVVKGSTLIISDQTVKASFDKTQFNDLTGKEVEEKLSQCLCPCTIISPTEERISLNDVDFIGTQNGVQNPLDFIFNYAEFPASITSWILNGEEKITTPIIIFDENGNYVYEGQVAEIWNTFAAANNIDSIINESLEIDYEIYIYNIKGLNIFSVLTEVEGETPNVFESESLINTITFPADLNNPTTEEVEIWADANLTQHQKDNGTQLTYYVDGDGGSNESPDFVWTLNKENGITLSNKRVFNSKTVYVDAGSGSDVTGKRGYREFPFKTLDAAIPECKSGDTLYVFPGDYTSTVQAIVPFNIYCEYGVNWDMTTALYNNSLILDTVIPLQWKFHYLYSSNTSGTGWTMYSGINYISFIADTLENMCIGFHGIRCFYDITNSINSTVRPGSWHSTAVSSAPSQVVNIKNVFKNKSVLPFVAPFTSIVDPMGKDNTQLLVNVENINIEKLSWQGIYALGFFVRDAGINKNYTYKNKNINFYPEVTYDATPSPFAGDNAWKINRGDDANHTAWFREGFTNGTTINFEVDNYRGTGNGVAIQHWNWDGLGIHPTKQRILNIKLKGYWEKGIPVCLAWNGFLDCTNCTKNTIVNIDLDVVCDTSPGVMFSFTSGCHQSHKFNISGKITTKSAGMPCIILNSTTNTPSGNIQTNGTITLKDLLLINDGTVPPLMINPTNAQVQNVQVQNVKSNSLIVDANITEVGESIVRNINYK